jgi:hypothetical protein
MRDVVSGTKLGTILKHCLECSIFFSVYITEHLGPVLIEPKVTFKLIRVTHYCLALPAQHDAQYQVRALGSILTRCLK